ncbi:AI-2E family transporter [Fulvivirga ligni]|uniref:AI-2E family transporter n=1 Tax=Fulvivirga ligni TaxID=2904246 RepID=UPI001F336ABE|nr:AI-2E family transporter [Fulvivirga ligni]UII20110.1 AI-2E family transporter [Fulvivirga ligni]
MKRDNSFLYRVTVILLLISLSLGLLVVARDFLYPICLGMLFSFLIYPFARLLEKAGLPRVPATLLSIISGILIFAAGMFLLYKQAIVFVEDFPKLKHQALVNINHLQLQIDELTGVSGEPQRWWLRDKVAAIFNNSGNMMETVFNATTGTVVKMGLQPVFIFFMLYYRDRFRKFMFLVAGKKHKYKMGKILLEVSEITKSYIGGVFIVVTILCFLNSIGLMIIGVEYAIMFGILSAVMNFIPYFGTLIGAAIPLAYTLVSDEPGNAIGVIILFIIIQFLENNILTPGITGGRVAINPLFTILVIIAGGMIWGVPGMFMSVPFAGMFKVVCYHYKSLRPLAFVMSKNKGADLGRRMQMLKNWIKRKAD